VPAKATPLTRVAGRRKSWMSKARPTGAILLMGRLLHCGIHSGAKRHSPFGHRAPISGHSLPGRT